MFEIKTLMDGLKKIAPRTKTSAVTDNNNKNLDTILSEKANSTDIPSKVSQLTNDTGFITNAALANYPNNTQMNAAINLLQKNIDDEVTNRKSTDTEITNTLNEESATREKADTTLQENIDNETSQRLLNVNSLRKDVDTFKGVSVFNGNGQTKVFTIEHNLSTKDLLVQAYSPIGGEELKFNVVRNLNSLELTFETAPQGEVRVVYMAVNSWSSEQLPFNLPFEQ